DRDETGPWRAREELVDGAGQVGLGAELDGLEIAEQRSDAAAAAHGRERPAEALGEGQDGDALAARERDVAEPGGDALGDVELGVGCAEAEGGAAIDQQVEREVVFG